MKQTTHLLGGVLLGTGLLLSPVVAQQSAKTTLPATKSAPQTATPPASTLQEPPKTAESFPRDALKAPMSLAAEGQTVDEVLHVLNGEGRPHLEAKNGAQDERLNVYANKQPVSRMMQGLHLLFNYPWIASTLPPAGSKQTLMATQRAREYEQSLWEATLMRRAAHLFKLTEYLQTSEAEYQRLDKELDAKHKQSDDPLLRDNLYYLMHSAPRMSLELLTTLTREQRLSLLEEGFYLLTPNAMSERQHNIAQASGFEWGRLRGRLGQALEGETPEDSVAMAEHFGLFLNVSADPVTGSVISYGDGLTKYTGGAAQFRNPPAPPDVLPVRGRPYNVNPEGRFLKPTYPELAYARFPAELTLDNDTDLTWREVMQQLAKYLKQPMFSDDYRFTYSPKARNGSKLPNLAKMSLMEGLDALCNHYRYLWWYEDGMLFFRSRTWFIEKQYEVPPPTLALLRQHLQAQGRLDIACLDALSTLTLRQLQGLNMLRASTAGEKDLETISDYPAWGRYAYSYLQVWPLLDAEQKEKVLSPDGLLFAEMSHSQQEAYVTKLYADRGPVIWSQVPKIRLLVVQNDKPLAQPQHESVAGHTLQAHVAMMRFIYESKNDGLALMQFIYTKETSNTSKQEHRDRK